MNKLIDLMSVRRPAIPLNAFQAPRLREIDRLPAPASGTVVCLRDGEIWASDRMLGGLVLTVQSGHIWLTRAGDPADVVLSAGQSFSTARGDGKVVIQPLGQSPARISVMPR
jgi:hypothetical protein